MLTIEFSPITTVMDDKARLLIFYALYAEKKFKRKTLKKAEVEIGSLSFKKVLTAFPLLKRSIRFFMIIRVEFKLGCKSYLLDTLSHKKIHNMLLISQMYRLINRFKTNVDKFIS